MKEPLRVDKAENVILSAAKNLSSIVTSCPPPHEPD
jgi:hypothetical protein